MIIAKPHSSLALWISNCREPYDSCDWGYFDQDARFCICLGWTQVSMLLCIILVTIKVMQEFFMYKSGYGAMRAYISGGGFHWI